jgi:hypothetical protein
MPAEQGKGQKVKNASSKEKEEQAIIMITCSSFFADESANQSLTKV